MNKTGTDVEIARDDEVTAYVIGNMNLDAAELTGGAAIPASAEGNSTALRAREDTQVQLEKLACGAAVVELEARKLDDVTRPDVAVPDGQALVYVVRPTFIGSEMQTAFSVDAEWRGVNLAESYFHFALAPGPHYFCSKAGRATTLMSLVVEAGHTYYVQQKFPYGSMELEVVEETEGKRAVAKCKRTQFSVKHESVR